MRDYIFRGKRLETGEWIESQSMTRYGESSCWLLGDDGFLHEVDMETVGQYTGLTDKNGKMIFEGDIVRYGDTIHEVVFEQRNGTAYFGLVYSKIETLPFGHYQDLKQIEVIGNIYDNSEFTKGE